MKWLTLASILLYLSRRSEAGALKSQEASSASENREISPIQNTTEREKETSPEPECQAGSEWESNCHYCRCSDSGIAECLKQDSCDLQIFEEPIRCKPFTTFRRDCNTCTCLKNGMGLCTIMDCFGTDRRKRENECEPGTTWKNSCNTCSCQANGIAVCTKKGCLSDPTSSSSRIEKRETPKPISKMTNNHKIVKRGVCKPNQEFQVDCNPCKCAANGLSYTCTHNECLEGENTNKEVEVFMESEGSDHIERHSVCKPRDTFYVGCNTCHCNPYGTDYSCTNKPCPLPKDVELFHELKENTTNASNYTKRVVCVANRMFIKDCNTCWCNEDGTSFFCTRKVCLPDSTGENTTEDPESEIKLRVVQKECRPNEVFEMDCNMCRCNADGKSYSCTRRACVDLDDKNTTSKRHTRAVQAEAPKTCQPGTEFRMDCNKCLCNDEGQDFSCTRIDCAAQNNNGGGDSFASARSKRELSEQVSTICVAGSVFDRECNVCRCTTDGTHAICTLKRCKTNPEPETEATPSFRCTPGDQFKRDCNDCQCSADGKTVFCTLRLCDKEGLS